MDETLFEVLKRLRKVEGKVEALEKLGRGGQRVAVGGVASDFADAGEADAAFAAILGVEARDGDALIVHRQSDDYLVVVVRAAGAWTGFEGAGGAIGYA